MGPPIAPTHGFPITSLRCGDKDLLECSGFRFEKMELRVQRQIVDNFKPFLLVGVDKGEGNDLRVGVVTEAGRHPDSSHSRKNKEKEKGTVGGI